MVMAIKVKQDMIDFIKNQGMAAALKRAGELKAKGGKGEAEFLEGVKRMYGASRLDAATAKASAGAAKATPSTRRKYGTPNKTSKPVMVDAKGPNAIKPAKKKPTTFGADQFSGAVVKGLGALGRTLSVEPRVTREQVQARYDAKKKKEAAIKAAAAKKNKK